MGMDALNNDRDKFDSDKLESNKMESNKFENNEFKNIEFETVEFNTDNFDTDGFNTDSLNTDNFYGDELDLFSDDTSAVDTIVPDPGMSATDAFIYCMNEKAGVDLAYMSAISGLDTDALIDALGGSAIYPDPEKYEANCDYAGCFTTSYQYLRGNLVAKYARALEINEKYGLFDDTVRLLEENLPDTVEPEGIRVNLGATWIPVKYIISFVQYLLETLAPPRIEYIEALGKWTVEFITFPNYVKNNYEYGTHRMSAATIIKHALNAKAVRVYDPVPKKDGKPGFDSVLNKQETLAAQQKLKDILDQWQDYVHGNTAIEEHLQEVYMESYGYSICRYDGSFLKLPGLNPEIRPYGHQLDAIARIVLNHNTLLAHEVGAGKTLEYCCGVHELLRMKLGSKALIVVPNNTFEAAVSTYKELYRDDSIFAVYPKKQFVPSQRTDTLNEIRSDKYRVIFMAYSSFDMLTLSEESILKKKQEKLEEYIGQIRAAKSYAARSTIKKSIERLKKDIEKFKENFTYKETACFDELGIDILVVDEIHNYKNITLDNKTDSIVGVHNAGSKKADNMLDKVEYIQSIDGHVIFSTGTPITNSMADLYVLQRYLQPEEIRLCNIFHFNDWINTFTSQAHTFEIDVDSKNYRYTTRFSKFHNLPELMSMFSDVCDFYRIPNGELGLPDFKGYSDIAVKKSEAQKAYIDLIAERTENIRAHRVGRREDNLLLITVDGRKCALDVRLVVPDAVICGEETKVSVCAGQMARIYYDHPGTTQIAFSDISTPKEGFNIYDELRSELVLRGIPAGEIMFIHEANTEAQRNKVEKRFNAGEIRILIGSTMKLGTGSNVQERLIAVHHLDVPWRPADMVQREGRIIRQGNLNNEVYVYRYCTEASFDAYTWQILENKQRFIAQFLSGSLNAVHRDESDMADTVLSYAEIKALAIGDPLIKERVEVANELEHARISHRQKRKELDSLQELLDRLPSRIKNRKAMISNAKADENFYKQNKTKVPMEEREMFGEELLYAIAHNDMHDKERLFGSYQGFDVILPRHMKAGKPYILLRRQDGGNSYEIKMDGDKARGCSRRIDHFLEHLADTISEYDAALEDLYRQKKNAEHSLAEGNEFEAEVDRLAARLAEIDAKLQGEDES